MNPEMLKGHLDTILLATLAEGPAHGYAVIQAIRQRSDGSLDLPEGTIYPALHRLELAGLLRSDWTSPSEGRRKRVYALTPAGLVALGEHRANWQRFARAVGAFLNGAAPCPA